jgi:hypothetical protein
MVKKMAGQVTPDRLGKQTAALTQVSMHQRRSLGKAGDAGPVRHRKRRGTGHLRWTVCCREGGSENRFPDAVTALPMLNINNCYCMRLPFPNFIF